nr:pentatricopeptide repeat-containing protein At3g07290, mitochondrial [Ipomoea batatas]
MELLEKIISNGLWPNEVTYNILMDGFCKASQLSAAFRILQSMKLAGIEPDGFTYTMLIDELCKDGKLEQASGFFGLMLKKGIAPDEVTLTALINGYCRAGKIRDSFIIFDRMISSRFLTSPHAFNSFLDALIKQVKLAEGNSIFAKMLKYGFIPSVVTYTILVSALCRAGNISSSLKIIDVMKQDGCQLNVYTYTAVIYGLCQSGRIEEAEDFLFKMPDFGVFPNDITYSILVKSHVKGGSLERALAIVSTMVQNGCEPNTRIYFALLSQIVSSSMSGLDLKLPSNELDSDSWITTKGGVHFFADSVFRQMDASHVAHLRDKIKQCGGNTLGVYNFLILGLCKVGRIAEAEDLVQEIVKSGYTLDKAISSCIMEYFCRYQTYDYCLHWVKLMINNGWIPSFASCSSVILGLRNDGKFKEAKWLVSNLLRDIIDDETAISSHIEFLLKGDEPSKCFDLLNLIHKIHLSERPII